MKKNLENIVLLLRLHLPLSVHPIFLDESTTAATSHSIPLTLHFSSQMHECIPFLYCAVSFVCYSWSLFLLLFVYKENIIVSGARVRATYKLLQRAWAMDDSGSYMSVRTLYHIKPTLNWQPRATFQAGQSYLIICSMHWLLSFLPPRIWSTATSPAFNIYIIGIFVKSKLAIHPSEK